MPGSSDTAGVDAAAIIAGLLVVFLFLAWYSFGRLTSFVPKVEKSKCSGCKTVSPVFSKKALKILKKVLISQPKSLQLITESKNEFKSHFMNFLTTHNN